MIRVVSTYFVPVKTYFYNVQIHIYSLQFLADKRKYELENQREWELFVCPIDSHLKHHDLGTIKVPIRSIQLRATEPRLYIQVMEVIRNPENNKKSAKRLLTPKAQYPTKESVTKVEKKNKLLSIINNQIKTLKETDLDKMISVLSNEENSGKNIVQLLKL